jgi:hypothetical protein
MGAAFWHFGRAAIVAMALAALAHPGQAVAAQAPIGSHLTFDINYAPDLTNPSSTTLADRARRLR